MSNFLLRLRYVTAVRLTSDSWRSGRRLLGTTASDPKEAFKNPSPLESPQIDPQPGRNSLLVNCHNEWDPLEEMIVGTFRQACVPPLEHSFKASWPRESWPYFAKHGGKPFPKEFIERGEADLNNLCHILEQEGVKVRRPEIFPPERGMSKSFSTPDFQSPCTMDASTPRDCLMVVGDTIVEAPMSWRCRFFDYRNYRKLVKEYFKSGAKWLPAPKGMLGPETYNYTWSHKNGQRSKDGQHLDYEWAITEFEPLFDTADFVRMGRDIFYQLSNVTNQFGVEWLQSHFPEHRFHRLSFSNYPDACHLDCHFVPMGPGKLMIKPSQPPDCGGPEGHKGYFTYDGVPGRYNLPSMFKGWDVFVAAAPQFQAAESPFKTDDVAVVNIIMLDEKRVCVDSSETGAIALFEKWGFKPVPVPLSNAMMNGAGLHCFTVDVRRRGVLQSYF